MNNGNLALKGILSAKEREFLLQDLSKRDTLESLIQTSLHFSRLFCSNKKRILSCSLIADGNMAELQIEGNFDNTAEMQHKVILLICWFRLCCWMTNKSDESLYLNIRSNLETDNFGDLFSIARCPIHFNKDSCSLFFEHSLLQAPVFSSRRNNAISCEQLTNILYAKPLFWGEDTIEARVIDAYRSENCRQLSANEVALCLNMSESSLRRRLKDSGTSFQRVQDAYRRDLAINMLKGNAMEKLTGSEKEDDESLTTIAYALGFSDASAFSRSFFRMTGHRPADYRAQLQQST